MILTWFVTNKHHLTKNWLKKIWTVVFIQTRPWSLEKLRKSWFCLLRSTNFRTKNYLETQILSPTILIKHEKDAYKPKTWSFLSSRAPITTDLGLNCSGLIYLSSFKVDLNLRFTFFAGRFIQHHRQNFYHLHGEWLTQKNTFPSDQF